MKNNSNTWYNLDNQANIYPAVSDVKNTNVYRLSCNMKNPVHPQLLQKALDNTIPSFPYYHMTIRRGLFWYYLEPIDIEPVVVPESFRPCKQLFYRGEKTLLFQLSYFNNRINLEVFHALADGGGAMEFFKTIIYNYIIIAFKSELSSSPLFLGRSAPPVSQTEDGFLKHYTNQSEKKSSNDKSFTIGGTNIPFNNVGVISAQMNAKTLLSLVKSKNTTLTAYLATLMICAIHSEMVPKRMIGRDVSVMVPVDLRSIFPSQTFRNFFSVVSVRYNFSKSPSDFDDVLSSVVEQLNRQITPESLARNINYNMSMQKSYLTRWVPLFIKNRILRLVYKSSESTNTTIVSNIGRIVMPEFVSDYIDSFTCLLNPTPIHKIKLCIHSYNDIISLDFTTGIQETDIQRYIIRHLTNEGVEVTITSNQGD